MRDFFIYTAVIVCIVGLVFLLSFFFSRLPSPDGELRFRPKEDKNVQAEYYESGKLWFYDKNQMNWVSPEEWGRTSSKKPKNFWQTTSEAFSARMQYLKSQSASKIKRFKIFLEGI